MAEISEQEREDAGAEGEAPPEGDQGGEDEGLVETIRRVAREVVSEMMGDSQPAPKAAGDPEARTWTPREIQEFAAAEMRRVQDELRAKAKAKPKPAPAGKGQTEGAPSSAPEDTKAHPPATTAPSNPKSWRNKLWGDA